jgi:hypothetical protein
MSETSPEMLSLAERQKRFVDGLNGSEARFVQELGGEE